MRKSIWAENADLSKISDPDFRDMAELIGIDLACKVWERFLKLNLYFKEKPLLEIKGEFIRANFPRMTVRELAAATRTSEQFVYNVLNERCIIKGQQDLFPE